jgi:transposase-like protein
MDTSDALAQLIEFNLATYEKMSGLKKKPQGEPEHARRQLNNEIPCPACGHEGPHDDNGASRRSDLSYCCCACGAHFDAEAV